MLLLTISECTEGLHRKHRGRDPLQKRKVFFNYFWFACLLDFIFNSLSEPYPACIITYAGYAAPENPVGLKPTQFQDETHSDEKKKIPKKKSFKVLYLNFKSHSSSHGLIFSSS